MTKPSDILTTAKKELGVKESPAGSNNVKYNTAYYGKTVSGSDYPWCCAFVWWVFKQAKSSDLFYGGKKTASCTTLMNFYKSKGQLSKTPKVGSLVFYNWGKGSLARHIGIVSEVKSNSSFTAIEGNTAVGNDSNGGEVMVRNRTVSQTLGFAYPYEDGTPTKEGGCNVELKTLKKGSVGNSVKALQLLLIGNGCSCGSAGADGDFGNGTLTAVKRFQSAKGLAADGIVGAKTWAKLLL